MIKKIKNIIKPVIKFNTFSRKQLQILTWWEKESPYSKYNGIICDGSIRAGKTVPMAISFVLWAMKYFDAQNFAMCGHATNLKTFNNKGVFYYDNQRS